MVLSLRSGDVLSQSSSTHLCVGQREGERGGEREGERKREGEGEGERGRERGRKGERERETQREGKRERKGEQMDSGGKQGNYSNYTNKPLNCKICTFTLYSNQSLLHSYFQVHPNIIASTKDKG